MPAIQHFPCMPKLTFQIKEQLRLHLPQANLVLKEEPPENPLDSRCWMVCIDNRVIGSYKIRESDGFIERNFFCCIPGNSDLPADAIEQGAFGCGGWKALDAIRIVQEYLWIAGVLLTNTKRNGSGLGMRLPQRSQAPRDRF